MLIPLRRSVRRSIWERCPRASSQPSDRAAVSLPRSPPSFSPFLCLSVSLSVSHALALALALRVSLSLFPPSDRACLPRRRGRPARGRARGRAAATIEPRRLRAIFSDCALRFSTGIHPHFLIEKMGVLEAIWLRPSDTLESDCPAVCEAEPVATRQPCMHR